MAKQKRQSPAVVYDGPPPAEIIDVRWGYGFERFGAKWKAYRTGPEGLEYLSPDRGEELHRAISKINVALAAEVTKAIRKRGAA